MIPNMLNTPAAPDRIQVSVVGHKNLCFYIYLCEWRQNERCHFRHGSLPLCAGKRMVLCAAFTEVWGHILICDTLLFCEAHTATVKSCQCCCNHCCFLPLAELLDFNSSHCEYIGSVVCNSHHCYIVTLCVYGEPGHTVINMISKYIKGHLWAELNGTLSAKYMLEWCTHVPLSHSGPGSHLWK